jgi:hypothetical protein
VEADEVAIALLFKETDCAFCMGNDKTLGRTFVECITNIRSLFSRGFDFFYYLVSMASIACLTVIDTSGGALLIEVLGRFHQACLYSSLSWTIRELE